MTCVSWFPAGSALLGVLLGICDVKIIEMTLELRNSQFLDKI